jgi:galactokinase
VESDLPAAAGLSSSTALVVAVARALITVNRIDVDPLVLIERLAAAERGVGAPGGAMDQAACVAGRPRVALKVAFEPLALAERPIPGNWRFVIAHSLVTADKAGSAERACRARIAECQEALAALQRMGVLGSSSYRNLLARYGGNDLLELSHRLDPVIGRRFRHVVSESLRVDEADRAVRHGMTIEFGRGMTASHASLRDDFAVSHPCLDRLIELSLSNGAVGAKLTGAGFGGCIVALTDGPADVLVEALTREFYDTVPGRPRIEHLVFVE